MTRAPLTVAILAGGAASRLQGRDKGLEPLLGRPLVEWVIEAVATAHAAHTLIVANRNPGSYARFAPVVADPLAGFRGPLAGVAAALAAAATPWLMTVPVDCPRPPADLAAHLYAAAQEHSADAVVAHDGARRQPLFAIYRRDLASSAAAAAERGWGVQQWQTSIGARELDFADRRAQFRNLNTPEEFAAYAAEHAR
jgi:molybdopterin-guanine dinucleotide biosynthesis protein A